MKFKYLPQFEKELKKLKKKIVSLEQDLENFKEFIPFVDFDNNKRYATLRRNEEKGIRIVKTRLMVRSLKGSTMTRVVFSFCVKEDSIEFIEIFIKNHKDREDQKRIDEYLKTQ